jgi:hypothetical protein
LPQAKDQRDSILIGQSKIDDEYVKCVLDGKPLGGFAICRRFHLVSRFLKRTPQETLDVYLVFHQ